MTASRTMPASGPDAGPATAPLLEVSDLVVRFRSRFGELAAVDGVSMAARAGEIVGLVGESGAGKSTIGAAVTGLLPGTGHVASGSVSLDGRRIDGLDADERHALRGSRISMIFQDPQTSLNPLMTVGEQLVETIREHADVGEGEARARAIALLDETGIADPGKRIDDHPHEFSGGMRQRVVIALALCTDPELIVADEPTTALDTAIRRQILALIRTLVDERRVGVVLITHDIGTIAAVTDRVVVLRRGRVVESGPTADVLGRPREVYTRSLMRAVPRLDVRLERFRGIVESVDADAIDPLAAGVEGAGEGGTGPGDGPWRVEGASAALASEWLLGGRGGRDDERGERAPTRDPVLEIGGLSVTFGASKGVLFGLGAREGFRALDDVSLGVPAGGTLGLVGESGSGKSTLAKAVVGLVAPSAGAMVFDGEPLPPRGSRPRDHASRRRIQMVFQDPYSSLNGRHRVESILAEPLREHALVGDREERRRLIASTLELVGLPQRSLTRYPHQFSGGQRQRIAVARALLARPELLIADEPTSALDVSVQAQVLNLLKDLQDAFGLAMLFVSHDLAVVRQIADRVVVLRRGRVVESADVEAFFARPDSEYGRELLRLTPSLELLAPPGAAA